MADHENTPEEKLRKLGRSLRQGWTKLYPVTNKEMARVREAVREHWEQTHPAQSETEEAPPSSTSLAKTSRRSKTQSQSHKSQSHDHGHSH
jgi:hypothetical protein